MDRWPINEAQARLSEVVNTAGTDDPQEITLHGRPVAVVLSREELDRPTRGSQSLAEFVRRSPLYGGDELELARPGGLMRSTDS